MVETLAPPNPAEALAMPADPVSAEAGFDNAINDMTNPVNILDLKAQYDHQLARAKDEATLGIDQRLDKDGQVAASNQELANKLRNNLIDQYTQVGATPDNPRIVPDSVKNSIARLMNLSYDELNEKAYPKPVKAPRQKAAHVNTLPVRPKNPEAAPSPFEGLSADDLRSYYKQAEQALYSTSNKGTEADFSSALGTLYAIEKWADQQSIDLDQTNPEAEKRPTRNRILGKIAAKAAGTVVAGSLYYQSYKTDLKARIKH